MSTGTAQELKDSTARVWGFGVVQKFDDVEPLEKKSKKAKNGVAARRTAAVGMAVALPPRRRSGQRRTRRR